MITKQELIELRAKSEEELVYIKAQLSVIDKLLDMEQQKEISQSEEETAEQAIITDESY